MLDYLRQWFHNILIKLGMLSIYAAATLLRTLHSLFQPIISMGAIVPTGPNQIDLEIIDQGR